MRYVVVSIKSMHWKVQAAFGRDFGFPADERADSINMRYLDDLCVFVGLLLGEQAGKRYAAQIGVDGVVQVFPQIMGQTRCAALAVGFAFAQCGVQLVFGGGDDLGNIDFARVAPQNVAAARPAYAFDQAGPAQFAE